MWPFRRRKQPATAVVRLGETSTDLAYYAVLSVGQSRLDASFTALEFTEAESPWFTWATLSPIVDPRMKSIADVTITVHEQIVGYLRPPALDHAIHLLQTKRAAALEVPVALVWGPTGPEVYLHLAADGAA